MKSEEYKLVFISEEDNIATLYGTDFEHST